MGDPVADVEAERLERGLDHLGGPGRTDDRQRCGIGGERGDPPGDDHVAQVGDVVAVQMGQQQRGQPVGAGAHGRQSAAAPRARSRRGMSDRPHARASTDLRGRASGIGLPVPSSVTSIMGPGIPAGRESMCAIRGPRTPSRVPEPVARDRRCRGVQRVELFGCQRHRQRAEVLLDASRAPGARDRHRRHASASARYRSHASATCAGVAPCCAATDFTSSTTARLASSAPSPEPRHVATEIRRRQVVGGADRSGEEAAAQRRIGDEPDPSSAAAGTTLASTSRLQIDHSLCTAAIGCTATAARSSSAVTSDSPRWRTLPAATSSAMAPTVSSIGTLVSRRCM